MLGDKRDLKTQYKDNNSNSIGNSTEKEIGKSAAEIYLKGEEYILKQDYSNGVLLLRSVLCKENTQAQALMGFCLEFGLGIQQDFSWAEKLYSSAGMQGDGLACARLSFLRRYGRPGVVIDRMEAEEWVKRVGNIEALSWLVKAADQYNLPAACYALGVCYHDGYFVFLMI
jgi:TPR repeat protein